MLVASRDGRPFYGAVEAELGCAKIRPKLVVGHRRRLTPALLLIGG
jgi:hypothetical protein